MRQLGVAVFGALLAQSCAAQLALTGQWVAEQVSPDGEKRQTVFNFFTPKNGAFTGYMSRMQGDFMTMVDNCRGRSASVRSSLSAAVRLITSRPG